MTLIEHHARKWLRQTPNLKTSRCKPVAPSLRCTSSSSTQATSSPTRSAGTTLAFSAGSAAALFGVQALFVLSGDGHLPGSFQRHRPSPAPVSSYLWKRFRRILSHLLGSCSPSPSFTQPFGARTYAYQHDPLAILSAVLLVKIHPESIVSVSWTLYHEIMFYFVFAAAILNRWLGIVLLSVWFSPFALSSQRRHQQPLPRLPHAPALRHGSRRSLAIASR